MYLALIPSLLAIYEWRLCDAGGYGMNGYINNKIIIYANYTITKYH